MTEHCSSCGRPVLVTPARVLEPAPDRVGVYDRDGVKLTARDAALAVLRQQPIGHREHHCPRPQQTALFEGGDAA